MKFTSLRYALGGTAFLLLPIAAVAASAKIFVGYPPPGLYRVEVTSTQHDPKVLHEMRTAVDASGSGMMTFLRPDRAPLTVKDAGNGQVTMCIPAQSAGSAPSIRETTSGALSRRDACKSTTHTDGPSGSHFSGECGGTKFDVTYRKIDEKKWEHKVSYIYKPSGALEPAQFDSAGWRSILANQAKHGATAAERAEAAAELARMGPYEVEQKKVAAMLAEARANLSDAQGDGASQTGSGTPIMQGAAITLLTRIADRCTAPGK